VSAAAVTPEALPKPARANVHPSGPTSRLMPRSPTSDLHRRFTTGLGIARCPARYLLVPARQELNSPPAPAPLSAPDCRSRLPTANRRPPDPPTGTDPTPFAAHLTSKAVAWSSARLVHNIPQSRCGRRLS
jgi:hypothetical protein